MDEKINIKNVFPCQLQELSLSCYGCCGRNWREREEIGRDLKENTKEFKKIQQKSSLRLLQFRDRFSVNPDDLKPSGLCSNLVDFGDGCIGCPLHPMINKLVDKEKYKYPAKNKDLRFNHCDINYECETFIFWKIMTDDDKKKFIKWVKKQNFDHFEYSTGNIDGSIIRKFFDEMDINVVYE